MAKLKSNFLDRLKIKDTNRIAQDVTQWQHDIMCGDDASVRLTDFAMFMYKPMNSRDNIFKPYVIKVRGYHVIKVGRDGSEPMLSYSPLAKQLLGDYDPRKDLGFNCDLIPSLQIRRYNFLPATVGLDPLDDNTSRQLMYVGTVSSTYFCNICVCARESERAKRNIERVCILMGDQDPLLAMVKLINSFPIDQRKQLLNVFDTYGPTDTLVGDALLHLDKFRSF